MTLYNLITANMSLELKRKVPDFRINGQREGRNSRTEKGVAEDGKAWRKYQKKIGWAMGSQVYMRISGKRQGKI